MVSRTKWIAGLAALALAGASSGTALGMAAYDVKLSVPTKAVPAGHTVRVTVTARSIHRALLDLWESKVPCPPAPPHRNTSVTHFAYAGIEVTDTFSKSFGIDNPWKGTTHVCAYLYSDYAHPHARAEASFHVK